MAASKVCVATFAARAVANVRFEGRGPYEIPINVDDALLSSIPRVDLHVAQLESQLVVRREVGVCACHEAVFPEFLVSAEDPSEATAHRRLLSCALPVRRELAVEVITA